LASCIALTLAFLLLFIFAVVFIFSPIDFHIAVAVACCIVIPWLSVEIGLLYCFNVGLFTAFYFGCGFYIFNP